VRLEAAGIDGGPNGVLLSPSAARMAVASAAGLAALAALILGKIFLKHKPVSLFVVIGGIVASSLLGLDTKGVNLLGEVPQGLPSVGIPDIYWSDLKSSLARTLTLSTPPCAATVAGTAGVALPRLPFSTSTRCSRRF
jgi:Sulfate permease family